MKINKKHIKKAIIIYEDPDLGENRRVIFGETSELIPLLIREMPIIMDRVGKLAGREFKTPMDLITYYMMHKEDWSKLHQIEASDNMELELSYEVHKF